MIGNITTSHDRIKDRRELRFPWHIGLDQLITSKICRIFLVISIETISWVDLQWLDSILFGKISKKGLFCSLMMVCKLWSSAALSVIYNREGCQNELKKKQEHEKCKGGKQHFFYSTRLNFWLFKLLTLSRTLLIYPWYSENKGEFLLQRVAKSWKENIRRVCQY